MIDRESLAQPLVRAALGLLAICGLLAAWTLARVITKPGEVVIATTLSSPSTVQPIPQHAPSNVGEAIENDPFSPFREPPPHRYRLPGEEAPAAATVKEEPPVPVVLGTAVMGAGHDFATCQLAGAAPTIVHVGDKVGEYTVKSIARGVVVFTKPGGKTLEIAALKSGA